MLMKRPMGLLWISAFNFVIPWSHHVGEEIDQALMELLRIVISQAMAREVSNIDLVTKGRYSVIWKLEPKFWFFY